MKLVNLSKKKNRGFTLIEILLVVGFIAMAGMGVYTVYSKVTLNNAANTEARNIDTIRAGIKPLFAGRSSTVGLNNTVVNNASVTPGSMVTAGSPANITNSFGGAVVISPSTLVSANDGFQIAYPSVPGAVCIKLVTGTGSQFERVTVGSTEVKPLGTNTQVDIVAATNACSADTGSGVTVNFFSLK